MSRFTISRQARQDLKEIYRYIARDKPTAAHRLRQTFESTFATLARNPLMGEQRPDFGADMRLIAVGDYVILFRPAKTGIAVARVMHGARDVAALWRPE